MLAASLPAHATDRPPMDPLDPQITATEVARLYDQCALQAIERVRASQDKYVPGPDEALRRFVAIVDDAAETVVTKHGAGLKAAGVDVRHTVRLLELTWRCKWTTLKGGLEDGFANTVARRLASIEAWLYADTPTRSWYCAAIRRAAQEGTLKPMGEKLEPLTLEIFHSIDDMLEADRPEMLRRVHDDLKEVLVQEMEELLPARYTCTFPGRSSSV